MYFEVFLQQFFKYCQRFYLCKNIYIVINKYWSKKNYEIINLFAWRMQKADFDGESVIVPPSCGRWGCLRLQSKRRIYCVRRQHSHQILIILLFWSNSNFFVFFEFDVSSSAPIISLHSNTNDIWQNIGLSPLFLIKFNGSISAFINSW